MLLLLSSPAPGAQEFTDYNYLTWLRDGKTLLISATVAGDSVYHLYRVDTSDGRVLQLTNGKLSDYSVAVSSDGKKLAYTEQCASNPKMYCLWISDTNAGDPKLIQTDAAEAAWSPDDRSLAFFSARAGKAHLFQLDLASLAVTQLTSGDCHDFSPQYSPDGTELVYESDLDGGGVDEIYLMDLGSKQVRRLTQNRVSDVRPTWTRDGKYIYWSQNSNAWFNLFRMRPDGSNVTLVEPAATQSAFGRDGTMAFLGYPRGKGHFQVFVRAEGVGVPRPVTDRDQPWVTPAQQP